MRRRQDETSERLSAEAGRVAPGRPVDVEITWIEAGQHPGLESHDRPEETDGFSTWVEPEMDFVRRVSRRMSSSQADADDLTQEVLTNAYRAIDRFDGRYPRAWLYRIASNAAASRARKRTPLLTLDGSDEPFESVRDDEWDPEAIVVESVMDAVLSDALDELPDHYRDVIDLVDLGGSSYEDAANALHIPMGTVMSRLHRGRRRLRDALAGSHLDRSDSRRLSAPV
jgi:RNA polymerase sigma-70 factor, ECF subfamily